MSRNQSKSCAGVLLIVGVLFSAPAFAYLDPGSGSAILQGILGALAALLVTLKLYWHRLLRLLGLKKGKPVTRTGKDAGSTPAEKRE